MSIVDPVTGKAPFRGHSIPREQRQQMFASIKAAEAQIAMQTYIKKRRDTKEQLREKWRLNDRIYGVIELSKVCLPIIQHSIFQRMREIKQLGPLSYKYRYADHSRYEHSLGVGHLARITIEYLRSQHRAITEREALCVEIAALCHDIGHAAYSHSFDQLLDKRISEGGEKSDSETDDNHSTTSLDELFNDLEEVDAPDIEQDEVSNWQDHLPEHTQQNNPNQQNNQPTEEHPTQPTQPTEPTQQTELEPSITSDSIQTVEDLNTANNKSRTAHHEVRSLILIEYIIRDLRKKNAGLDLTDAEIRLIQYFIDPTKYLAYFGDMNTVPKFYKGIEQIVNNINCKVDVDKMDYLVRDAMILRYDEVLRTNLDIIGMLRRTLIINEVWCFAIRDQNIIYDLIHRRILFYSNHYLHPQVNAINCMLTDAMISADKVLDFTQCVKLSDEKDIQQFAELTDSHMENLMLNNDDPRLSTAKSLFERMMNQRDLYQHMGEYISTDPNPGDDYCRVPWNLFTDASGPVKILSKIKYHKNGEIIDPDKVKYMSRIYMKSPQRKL